MKMSAETIPTSEITKKMLGESKQVILMDGMTKIDRNAMRQFIKSKGISLLNPKIGYIVFKITGNLAADEDE